jgi:hypothetical protein
MLGWWTALPELVADFGTSMSTLQNSTAGVAMIKEAAMVFIVREDNQGFAPDCFLNARIGNLGQASTAAIAKRVGFA